eukprot:Gb_12914 [translate_table: standard]
MVSWDWREEGVGVDRIGLLNAAYLEFCKTTSMHPLTVPEFSSMCRVLSDQALLQLGQSREDRLRRVTLKVDEGDVTFALQVQQICVIILCKWIFKAQFAGNTVLSQLASVKQRLGPVVC